MPPEAIVSFAGVTKVFVAEGDKARVAEIELGVRGDWVEVGRTEARRKVDYSGQSQLVEGSRSGCGDARVFTPRGWIPKPRVEKRTMGKQRIGCALVPQGAEGDPGLWNATPSG